MPKWLVIGIVTLVVLVISGVIVRESIYTVNENNYAVVLQFQEI